jgi:hypothetical protein
VLRKVVLSTVIALLAYPTTSRADSWWVKTRNKVTHAVGQVPRIPVVIVQGTPRTVASLPANIKSTVQQAMRTELQNTVAFVHQPTLSNFFALSQGSDPQFWQLVAGLKALRVNGVLATQDQCFAGAQFVAGQVADSVGQPEAGDLATKLGTNACGAAFASSAAPNPGAFISDGSDNSLPAVTANPGAPIQPISQCQVGSFPGHPAPHTFFLMSDLSFADRTPAGYQPFNRAEIDASGVAAFVARDDRAYWAFGHNGEIYLLNGSSALLVGRCSS